MKANERPRARVEDKTGARLGEGRRTEKDEGPLKNKNKRNRLEVGGECHCDRRGGLHEIHIKKKIEGQRKKERQKEKRKDESRNKKGKEDGDYAIRGVGRRKEEGEARKIKEQKERKRKTKRLFTKVEERKKKAKISVKRSGE